MPKSKAKTLRKWSLNESEKMNLQSRKQLIEQLDYQRRLVDVDMQNYIIQVVMPRCGIEKGTKVKVLPDLSWIEEVIDESCSGK